MENGRLFVPEKSKYKLISLACTVVSLVLAAISVPTLFFAAFASLFSDVMSSTTRTALFVLAMASLVAAAQAFYEFYGVLRSHVTLAHFGYALIAYPVLDVLVSESTEYAEYVQMLEQSATVTVMRHIDYLNLVVNIIDILLWLAMGAVFLLYASGKLCDKRIAMFISGVACLLSVAASSVSLVVYYMHNTASAGSLAVMVVSIGIMAGSSALTYAVPFFLALSMKNAKEDICV